MEGMWMQRDYPKTVGHREAAMIRPAFEQTCIWFHNICYVDVMYC